MIAEPAKTVADHTEEIGTMSETDIHDDSK